MEQFNNLEGRLFISDKAHLNLPYHALIDQAKEKLKGDKAIGTTGKGIGPAYSEKISRTGFRIGELLNPEKLADGIIEYFEQNKAIFDVLEIETPNKEELTQLLLSYKTKLEPYIANTTNMIWDAIDQDKKILLEGAQGTLLDIDHGTYPYVTSSSCVSAGACTGLGISPKDIGIVTGIVKAYTTRVGNGPFPSEDFTEQGQKIASIGKEVGVTTGRGRRCVITSYSIHYTKLYDFLSDSASSKSFASSGSIVKVGTSRKSRLAAASSAVIAASILSAQASTSGANLFGRPNSARMACISVSFSPGLPSTSVTSPTGLRDLWSHSIILATAFCPCLAPLSFESGMKRS